MPHEFVEDVTWADVAFKATGKNLEELFTECALATTEVMIEVNDIETSVEKDIDISVSGDNKIHTIEKLLFDFLSEIVYLKDTEILVFSEYDIKISGDDKNLKLSGKIRGERIDPDKHIVITDVKAVTMHKFEVKHENNIWEALVVLDI